MIAVEARAEPPAGLVEPGLGSGELVRCTLDLLEVTDRVYHELRRTVPLVTALVEEVRRLPGPLRVVAIAPNELLLKVLAGLGHRVEVWRVDPAVLGEEAAALTTRRGSLDKVLAEAPPPADLLLLPYVLEAAAEEPARVLRRLGVDGRLVVACRHSGALIYRRRAIAGRPLLDPPAPPRISLGWPDLPPRRVIARGDLAALAAEAGLVLERQRLVIDRTATSAVQAMSLSAYLGARLKHLAKHLVPPWRDCIVATLTPGRPA